MTRELIHDEFPFTEEEVAAAWIVHGQLLAEALEVARATSATMRLIYSESEREANETGTGWFSGGGISFVGGFEVTLHLIADVHADGQLLSDVGRALRLEQWRARGQFEDVETILDSLAALGESWAARRQLFRDLLNHHGI